jgi:CheY-like chemotaxis protein/HPt (histidine-containing phosphotransfer) domain-containing protein
MTSLGHRLPACDAPEFAFAGHVTKPVRRNQLYGCLLGILRPESPRAGQTQSAPKAAAESLAAAVRGLRVLIAEDNPINQEVALTILRKNGVRADAVANGIEAVKALQDIPYDLVLMDMQMPEMDGLEATRAIRRPGSRVRNPRVPVIAMTANVRKADQDECRTAGMDDFLSKPIHPIDLIEKIAHWVSVLRAGDGSPAEGPAPLGACAADAPPPADVLAQDFFADEAAQAVAPPVAEAINFEELCERVMGEREAALEMLEQVFHRMPQDMDEMRRHVEAGDLSEIKRLGHKLRGTAANLSITALSGACGRLDLAAKDGDAGAIPALHDEFIAAAHAFLNAFPALRASEEAARSSLPATFPAPQPEAAFHASTV